MIPSINDDVYVHKRRVSPVPTAPKPPSSTAKASKIAGDKAKRVSVSSLAGSKTTSTQPTSLRLRKQAQVPVSSATGTKATSRARTSLRSRKEATSAPSVVASNPKLTRVSVRRDPLQESKTRIPKPEATRLAQKSSAARLIKSPAARYSAQDGKTSKLPIAASYKQKENKTVAVAVKKSLTRKDAVPITTKQSKTETSRRLSGAPVRPSAPAGGVQNSARLSRIPLLYPLKPASNVRKPSVRALADGKARGEPKPQLAAATKRSKAKNEEKSQASSESCSEEETTPVGKGRENNSQFNQEKTKLNKKPSLRAVAKAKSSGLPRLNKGQPLATSTLKGPQSTKHTQWSSSTKIPTGTNRQALTYPRPTSILNRKSPPPETVEGKNSARALPQSAAYRRRVDGVERTTPPKDKRSDMAAGQDVQETVKETSKRLPTPLSPAKGSVTKQQKISTSPLPEPKPASKPANRRDFLRRPPTSGGTNVTGSPGSDRIVKPVRVSREISTRAPSRPDVSITKSVNMRNSGPRIVKPVARAQSQRGTPTQPSPSGGPRAAAGRNCRPRIVKPVVRSPTAMEICIRYTVGSGGNSGPRIVRPVSRPQVTSRRPSGEEVKVIRGGKRKSSTNVKAKIVKPVSRDSIIPDRTVSSPGSLAVQRQGRPEAMDERDDRGIDLDPNDQLNTLANKSEEDDTKDCHSGVAEGRCDNFISKYQSEIDTIIALDPADLKAVDDVDPSSEKAIAEEDDMEVDEDGIVAEY